MTHRLDSIAALRAYVGPKRRQGQRIGFVPTMGYLHQGHLSLIEKAKLHADIVIVSIFVNPTQFSAHEDLETYPRDVEGDLAKLEQVGADAVFLPAASDIYDGGPEVNVSIPILSHQLCGASRPSHFAGVCQVVLKLFSLVQCDIAVFGQKDFQQLTVIKRLVASLFLPIEIVAGDIVRELDGLAMSSRNVYLSAVERSQATVLSKSLQEMRRAVENGETDIERIRGIGLAIIRSAPKASLEYLEIVNRTTLAPLSSTESLQWGHALVAIRFGQTRLIDNMSLV